MKDLNEQIMSIDKLTDDEKHNFSDLTDGDQKDVLCTMVPFNTKANILTCDSAEDACYLCKKTFSSEAHLRQHIKAHLRKMGATGDAYYKRSYFQNLEEVPKLKKLGDEPIFYHPDDCDCIKCLARTEKGGLDYDPSNDDEEFEEHERQVLRDVGITEKEDK